MNGATQLEVVYDWRDRRLEQRLLAPGESLTFGTGPTAMFVAPEGQADHLGRDPWPRSMPLLTPRRGGYRLRLLPSMTGLLKLQGKQVDIGSLFDVPAPKRLLRKPAVHRDVELSKGDSADIVIDAVNQLRISLAFVEAPEKLARPRRIEPLLFKAAFWSVNTILATLIVVLFVGSRIPPFTPQLEVTPERLAKLAPPPPDPVKVREKNEAKLAEEARRKKMELEAAEARRAKLAEGKLGHPDNDRKETVLPKGREDVLREKVAKVGILSVLGRAKAPGSSLSNLLANDTSDIEQAVISMQGAKLAAGKGSGGLTNTGSSLGGGGTSYGKIGGIGNLDVGAGRGRGRRGPNLGSGRERQVQAGVETGSPDAEGGLSKDQVMRVVRSHQAAIKFCFDKEFQRNPHLNGRIDLFWVIHPNGTVDRAKVAKSAMNNDAVEGCLVRQVKSWAFPKADADTIVQSFPFFFKGTGG